MILEVGQGRVQVHHLFQLLLNFFKRGLFFFGFRRVFRAFGQSRVFGALVTGRLFNPFTGYGVFNLNNYGLRRRGFCAFLADRRTAQNTARTTLADARRGRREVIRDA